MDRLVTGLEPLCKVEEAVLQLIQGFITKTFYYDQTPTTGGTRTYTLYLQEPTPSIRLAVAYQWPITYKI